MSIHKKLAKLIQTIFRKISRISRGLTQKLMNWLLRGLLVISRRQGRLSTEGFALPTTIMVILVVALLTTAILVRSFNWSKNVANYRVSQEVVNAALPALDRAKKKIDALLQDQQLPRGTPTELAIDNVLKGNLPTSDKYTLADENRIQLAYDIDGDGSVRPNATSSTIENREATANAWRFFVDSDNNGKFDSVTLYSILFRTPPQGTSANEDTRQRQPLEARALPMQEGQGSQVCAAGAGTSASLVGSKGWYAIGSQIKRAFFVYVATVPITDPTRITNLPSGISAATQLEKYKGDPRRFSALEYQQDQGKTPIGNNAVFYNDDLTITAGGAFTINGRIVANSNLFVDSQNTGAPITLRQVSSQYSCYYLEENGKIVVGGNVAYGYPDVPAGDGNAVNVDLFQGPSPGGTNPAPAPATADKGSAEATLTTGNQSVDGNIFQIGFNDAAYEGRISQLVAAVTADGGTGKVATDPPEVQQTAQNLIKNGEDPRKAREDALDTYFRGRTRKVPYAEVPFQGTDNANAAPDGIGTPLLAPKAPLMFPFSPADGKTPGGYAELTLKTSGNGLLPKATQFKDQEKGQKIQKFAGDRVVIGNNLPQQWLQDGAWVSSDTEQIIEGTAWDSPAGAAPRQRKSRVQLLTELGNTDRDQFWENKAQTPPPDTFASYGGLRVVTGAGIYLPPRRFPNIPTNDNGSNVIWPDTMPVIRIIRPAGSPYDNNVLLSDFSDPPAPDKVFGFKAPPTDAIGTGRYRPFLQMRATAVYHYTYPPNPDPRAGKEPIACVSSFYDPTTADTARNNKKLVRPELDVSGGSDGPPTQQNGPLRPVTANSNNGITYPPPSITFSDAVVRRLLNYQADLVYPNGRPVNPALKNALRKARFGGGVNTLSLSEKASIDAALCALEIMGVGGTPPNPTTTPTAGYTLPHGTIKEVAFLDARQIKLIDSEYKPEPTGGYTGLNTLTGKYDLPIELRQPLEVRATVLDLQKLRKSATPNDPFSNAEYLLPNSGIIYATRDDALPDISDDVTTLDGKNSKPKQAAIDFHLDPTRRPNGIMLINGTPLYRDSQFRQIEKGLILASNLPVYVKADASDEFNSHKTVTPANTGAPVEEFTDHLVANASTNDFYGRQTLDPNFACRTGDTRLPSGSCPVGDQWRSATILTDSITLLSHSFREGYRSDGDYDLRNNQIDNIASPASANELKTPTGITPVIDYTAAAIEKTLQQQGFFDNNFVTSHPFTDTDYSTTTPIPIGSADKNSSYFNNFVTPIQRRGQFPELLMEWCPHLDVSRCGPNDWFVDDGFTVKATSTVGSPYRQGPAGQNQAGTTVDPGFDRRPKDQQVLALLPRRVAFARNWKGGTTRQDNLILSSTGQPVILGIDGSTPAKVACYTYSGTVTPSALGDIPATGCQPYAGGTPSGPRYNPDPTKTNNALWFRTTGAGGNISTIAYDGANPPTYINPNNPPNPNIPPQFRLPSKTGIGPQKQQQPLLVPVLQIQHPTQSPTNSGATIPPGSTVQYTQWLQRSRADTTFNLAMATGNNPDHPPDTIGTGSTAVNHEGDFNGGLANLPHLLENWYKPNTINAQWSTIINGSFIQLKRSVYATAPFTQLPTGTATAGPGGPFNYPVGQGYPQVYRTLNTKGKMPSYLTPNRQVGFDLGLLSQIPDLFSQQFVLPPTEQPNEFFREVDRNDTWVQALLCAKIPDPTNPDTVTSTHAINDNERPGSFCQSKTGN